MLTFSPTVVWNWLFLIRFTYFCAFVLLRLFIMQCTLIYYLNSAVSDNKNELIQVVVTGNVTTHKMVHIMEPYSANTFKRDLGAPYLWPV